MHTVHPHISRYVCRRLLVEFSGVLDQDMCFPRAGMRCAGGLWGLSPHQLNMVFASVLHHS